MLSVCEHFGTEERNDVVRYGLDGFVAEVGVIDAERCVEPLDFVGDEFARDESLDRKCVVSESH